MRIATSVILNDKEQSTLEKWSRGKCTPVRLVTRAKIVLLAARGLLNKDIALEVGVGRDTVGRWRERFAQQGLSGIEKDAPRGGRTPTKRSAQARKIIETTTQEKPQDATHWTTRTLAKHLDVSPSMVQRVWKAYNLKPHRVKNFKVSNDKQFIEKMTDVVGLYLNPPEHALVLCVDEKTSIQALDRTQPGLPIKKGRCETMTHDYKRNGTTTLFAALELAEGRLIGTCMKKHRHQEWLKFLRQIDRETPPDKDLHLIVDNYATHKHPKVKKWLQKHPRFNIHFTPTSCSWLNLIERWFGEITDKRIRRGVFRSEQELVEAIMRYIQSHNDNPRTYTWTAKAEDILKKVRRASKVLDKIETV